jgi:hypothetical protein
MLRAATVWLHVTLAGAPSRRPASSSWLSHAQVGIPRPSPSGTQERRLRRIRMYAHEGR